MAHRGGLVGSPWSSPCTSVGFAPDFSRPGALGGLIQLSVRLRPGRDLTVREFEPRVGLGRDLTVREFEPRVGLCADGLEPASDSVSPSFCPFPVYALSLSLSLSQK